MLRVMFFLFGLSTVAFGENEKTMAVSFEGGYGQYGLAGVEIATFFTKKIDLHFGIGVGNVGSLFGAGAQFYFNKYECFFFKHCADQYYFDITWTQTATGNTTTTHEGNERIYRSTGVNFANVGLGHRTVFYDYIGFDVNIGYRFSDRTPNVTQISGPIDEISQQNIKDEIEAHENTALLSLGLSVLM
ncbi:MAG: hypothetical protein KBD78_10530 [Oligoflexales bacterium]|nr:hypothetical protein [Oligoflexales bacterium]